MMQECEKLILFISNKLGRDHSLCYQDYRIDLRPPWNRMTVKEAFHRYSPIILETAIETNRFDEMMAIHIEPHLGKQKPLFLFGYPRQFGALARLSPQDPTVAERFELYIAGMELCNAFTELTDKKEQRRRFSDEQNHRSRLGKTVYPVDDKFLDALSDMPEASGNALGIDRLTMLFVDTTHIDDVVAFTPEDL